MGAVTATYTPANTVVVVVTLLVAITMNLLPKSDILIKLYVNWLEICFSLYISRNAL